MPEAKVFISKEVRGKYEGIMKMLGSYLDDRNTGYEFHQDLRSGEMGLIIIIRPPQRNIILPGDGL